MYGIVHEIIGVRFENLEGMNLVIARTVVEYTDNIDALIEATNEWKNSIKVCMERINKLESLIREQNHKIKILKKKCRDQETQLAALTKKIKVDEAHTATGIHLLRSAVGSLINKMHMFRISNEK